MGMYDDIFQVGPVADQQDQVNQMIQEELTRRKQNAVIPQHSTGLGALFEGVGNIIGDHRSRDAEGALRTQRAGLAGRMAGLHSRYADILMGSKPEDLPNAALAGELSGSPSMAKAGTNYAATALDRDPALRNFYGSELSRYGSSPVPPNMPMSHIKELLSNARTSQQAESAQKNQLEIANVHGRSAENVARINAGARVTASGMDSDTVPQIAEGIIDGTIPPDLKGNMRLKAPIQAYLHQKGFDLSGALREWNGTVASTKALNSDQQVRVRQGVDATHSALDNIESLYNDWKAVAKATGRFPLINRAALGTSKQLGGDVGAAANALEGAIADWKGKYANVLMGGNAPTDRALKLVDNNLNAAWDDASMTKNIGLARRVLKMQAAAMDNTRTAGGSRYDATGGGATSAAPKADPKLQEEINGAHKWLAEHPGHPQTDTIKANFKKMHGVDL